MRFIFGGRELKDEMYLKDCNLKFVYTAPDNSEIRVPV